MGFGTTYMLNTLQLHEIMLASESTSHTLFIPAKSKPIIEGGVMRGLTPMCNAAFMDTSDIAITGARNYLQFWLLVKTCKL